MAPGGDVLAPSTAAAVSALAARVTTVLDTLPEGRWGVEVGVDLVIDREGAPWLVEVNSRPRVRAEALAAADPGRFQDEVGATACKICEWGKVCLEGSSTGLSCE